MDGANNETNTLNAYAQKVYESLALVTEISFQQPLLDAHEQRTNPLTIPTNLGVDGSDIFSLAGLEYYKRAGTELSETVPYYRSNHLLPWRLQDLYDNILYPINVLAAKPVSQLDAAVWLFESANESPDSHVIVLFWMGNNDSSSAALGFGPQNPVFIPLPRELIEPHITPALSAIFNFGLRYELVSFQPYIEASITRNLTDEDDFKKQYAQSITTLLDAADNGEERYDVFLCTLPYYSSVGYLFDSEDLEFYLTKVYPDYTVPPTFARVAPPGEPITDYCKGDRVPFMTVLCMYVLLAQGYSPDYVNQALETDGVQNDGLVLSESEQRIIQNRIDGFNTIIRDTAAASDGRVHLIDIGEQLNSTLTGATSLVIDGRTFTRKWGRGGSFTIDGVHPGYTTQAFIANIIIEHLNQALGLSAPLHDLPSVREHDPYRDDDGDGWVPGPDHAVSGIPEILLKFTDPDDTDPDAGPLFPDTIWNDFSRILIQYFIL